MTRDNKNINYRRFSEADVIDTTNDLTAADLDSEL